MWFLRKDKQKEKRKLAKKFLESTGEKDVSDDMIDMFIKNNSIEEMEKTNNSETDNTTDKKDVEKVEEDKPITESKKIDKETDKSHNENQTKDKSNIEDEQPLSLQKVEEENIKSDNSIEVKKDEEKGDLNPIIEKDKPKPYIDNKKPVPNENKEELIDKDSVKTEIQDKDKTSPSLLEKEVVLNRGEIPIQISNAIVGSTYKDVISQLGHIENIKSLIGLKKVGGLIFNPETNVVSGIPKNPGEYFFEVDYTTNHKKKIKLIVNQDPKKLWKNIPSKQEYKTDDYSETINKKQLEKSIIGASKRGRSHEHQGTDRDDHFVIDIVDDWYITIVADGAGSASLSSLGSKIVAEKSIQIITEALTSNKSLLDLITEYSQNNENETKVRNALYKILAKSAHESYKALYKESENKNTSVKKFHTTLLITLTKKFDFGYFVAGFQIGDGISAICQKDSNVILLGWPDSGEYAGQTRFVTDANLYTSSDELYNRIKFKIVNDFNAIFSMTDGISDPIFGDEKNLKKTQFWNEFNNTINNAINSNNNLDKDEKLLKWMNFYQEREHDDRTLVIIS